MGLDPDLVLAPNVVSNETVSKLRSTGLTVYKFRKATSIDFIAEKTLRTGKLIGRCRAATERTETFREEVDTIEEAVEGEPRPTAVHILGASGYAAGRETFINKIIEKSGGENVAAEKFAGYQQISTETVLAEDPEWITRPRSFDLSEYAGTTAVERDQVVTLDANYVSQPAPRIVVPMVKLVKTWHPDSYREARLGDLVDDESASENWPTTYGSSVAGDTATLSVKNFEYDEQGAATFSVPTTFDSERDARLTTVRVDPGEPDVNFEVAVTRRDGSAAIPDDATPIAGYRFAPDGLFDESSSVSATARVDLTERNLSASDVVAYRNANGTWTRTAVETERSGSTLELRANTTASASLLFAALSRNDTTTQTVTATPTVTTTPTASSTPTATATPTATTIESPTATEPTTQSPTSTTTAATGPGFGTLPAVLALVVGLLLARKTRRP